MAQILETTFINFIKIVSSYSNCIEVSSEGYSRYTTIHPDCFPWWRHQMETFSALLVLCVGNSPVTGEFPSHRSVTRSFDVFRHLCLNKRLSKQSWGWWFETPSPSLWRHCNALQQRIHRRFPWNPNSPRQRLPTWCTNYVAMCRWRGSNSDVSAVYHFKYAHGFVVLLLVCLRYDLSVMALFRGFSSKGPVMRKEFFNLHFYQIRTVNTRCSETLRTPRLYVIIFSPYSITSQGNRQKYSIHGGESHDSRLFRCGQIYFESSTLKTNIMGTKPWTKPFWAAKTKVSSRADYIIIQVPRDPWAIFTKHGLTLIPADE